MTERVTTQTAVIATLPDGTAIGVDQLPTGELVQLVKLLSGAPDSATPVVLAETANGLKVDGSAVTQPVSAAALPLPTGASTSANQATELASLASIDGKTPALVGGRQPVDGSGVTQPVSGPLTDAQLRATPVPISGAVTVSDGSGPLTIDGTVAVSNFPATQPVSGPLTDAQLRATAVPVTDAATLALDADLKAEIGAISPTPGAYTVLDRLNAIAARIDAAAKTAATEATLKTLVAALSKPIARPYSTLLHR